MRGASRGDVQSCRSRDETEAMTVVEHLKERVRHIAAPIIQARGLELVDVEWSGRGPRTVVRILIDKPGGVGVADCEEVLRSLGHALDVEDPIPHSYVLEVSSPGLERPFRQRTAYEKNIGTKVRVKLKLPRNGEWRLAGTLLAVEDSGVTLAVQGGRVEKSVFVGWDEIGESRREIGF